MISDDQKIPVRVLLGCIDGHGNRTELLSHQAADVYFLPYLMQDLDLINQTSYHKDMEKCPAYKMKPEKKVMVTVYRQEIAEWLLMEYHAALHTVREKMK